MVGLEVRDDEYEGTVPGNLPNVSSAITKTDLLDQEIIHELKKELPINLSSFISSVTGLGIEQLKDLLWQTLNEELD